MSQLPSHEAEKKWVQKEGCEDGEPSEQGEPTPLTQYREKAGATDREGEEGEPSEQGEPTPLAKKNYATKKERE